MDPDRRDETARDIWNDQLRVLDRYYRPGKFTPLAGFRIYLSAGRQQPSPRGDVPRWD